MADMVRRRPGPGRPSKGDRTVFTTRIPAQIAEALRAYADEADLSYSEAVANAVAEKFGFPPVASPPVADQQKLIA